MTGNSGFFKLVHCGSFAAVISSNSYALCAGGNTVLSIFRVEWTEPTQIFIMAQSLDASVSSLMSVGLVAKYVCIAEVYFHPILHD